MEYSGEGVSVFAEAKGEVTRQLCSYLTPALLKFFLEMLDTAKQREVDKKKHLVAFQTLLEGIAEWNVDKVQRETQTIAMSSQCDYLEDLLTAVFVSHTKVLSAIRLTNRKKKLQITIPKLEHFLHRTMTECARILWSNTFLFATTGSGLEQQKNMRQVEALITEGVLQGIRGMLPVKSILREYLGTEDGEEGEEEEEEEGEDAEEGEEEEEGESEKVEAEAPAAEVATEVEEKSSMESATKSVAESMGPTGSASPLESEPLGPTGVPTIVLDSIPAAVETLFPVNVEPEPEVKLAPTPAPPTPKFTAKVESEPELVEMDDIPIEDSMENILEEEVAPPAPLSIEDDGGFEFEEL